MARAEDEGFEALLRPLTEILRHVENGTMDLALHLDEYINYIHQICGDDIPVMNFAQAALLVQNSATIYSKKVDQLFTKVIEFHQFLTERQEKSKSKEDDQGQPTRHRRKIIIDTEEFACLDDLNSDRNLSWDEEKEKQKIAERLHPKIVLNAGIKVKAKEMTSCNIHNFKGEVMGKKEEFRLNWRLCSAGTLHEEFVISKSRFKALDPLEITVAADESYHDFDDHGADSGVDEGPPPPPPPEAPPPPLATSICSFEPLPTDRESELVGVEVEARNRPNEVKVDAKEVDWKPNELSIKDLPMKKRKTDKPLEDGKKRKINEVLPLSLAIYDILLLDKYSNTSFCRDKDFCYLSKDAAKQKRQLLLQHRSKYNEYMEKETGTEETEDFHGFYIQDVDSDHENDFEGYDDGPHDDDDNVPEVDVPLPDIDVVDRHAEGKQWATDDGGNNYVDDARRTMEAYRSKKIDHSKISDMARRVEEWHQKILPTLEAAEQRSSFDIQEYGSKVLNSFTEGIGSVKTFEEIARGLPREEVARYFLSSLVLANQYNVEISETQQGDLNVDCVQLKLLSVVRHHEELDDNLRQTSDK